MFLKWQLILIICRNIIITQVIGSLCGLHTVLHTESIKKGWLLIFEILSDWSLVLYWKELTTNKARPK